MTQPGASTETPADAGTATPPEGDPSAAAPDTSVPAAAPTGDAPTGQDATPFEAPFKLEDVPEEYRHHVEHYIARTRPAVTSAFQEASQVRAAAEEALQYVDALNSPDTAYEVLRDTLDEYGIELTEDIWAAAQQASGQDEPGDAEHLQPNDPTLKYLVEREQAREAAEQAERDQAESARARQHVQSHLSALAEARGYGEDATSVPSEISTAVAAFAAVLPYSPDGQPNMQGAQEMLEALEAKAVQDYLARKQPEQVPGGGGAGERRADLSDPKQRFALAEEIAQRAMAAHQ